ARKRHRSSRRAATASGSPPTSRPHARRRSRPAWPCAPPRSRRAPSAVAPTACVGPPPPSARRASRPSGGGPSGQRPSSRPVRSEQEDGGPTPFERAVQGQRAAEAERRLARLGKVNPLALEEFAALQERSAFLTQQVEDLTRTRKELLGIVRDVDDRVLEVMGSAFADTAREFELVFPTLFPGGEGRLVLTDPENLLTTGIEVEVRPAGKRVSRLSLLSGGERSMAALAFLLAVFRARPSPF